MNRLLVSRADEAATPFLSAARSSEIDKPCDRAIVATDCAASFLLLIPNFIQASQLCQAGNRKNVKVVPAVAQFVFAIAEDWFLPASGREQLLPSPIREAKRCIV